MWKEDQLIEEFGDDVKLKDKILILTNQEEKGKQIGSVTQTRLSLGSKSTALADR